MRYLRTLLACAALSPLAAAHAQAPTAADLAITTTLAERARGTEIGDAFGNPVGLIDASDDRTVILTVGAIKLRMPASALRKAGGKLTIGLTADQITRFMAMSAAYQQKTSPQPTAPAMPSMTMPPTPPPLPPAAMLKANQVTIDPNLLKVTNPATGG